MNEIAKNTFCLFDKFFIFALVGLCGTATQYAVLWVGFELFNWRAAVASGIGYFIGALVNYYLNHSLTFGNDKEGRSHLVTMPRYYISVGAGWCINVVMMAVLVDSLNYNTWVMQILVTGVCLVLNYLAARLWIFRG